MAKCALNIHRQQTNKEKTNKYEPQNPLNYPAVLIKVRLRQRPHVR